MRTRKNKMRLHQVVYYNCQICLITEIDGFGNVSQLTHIDHNSYECIARDIIQERIFSPSIVVMQMTSFVEKHKQKLFQAIEASKYSNRINKGTILSEIENIWYNLLKSTTTEDEIIIRRNFIAFVDDLIRKISGFEILLDFRINEEQVFV